MNFKIAFPLLVAGFLGSGCATTMKEKIVRNAAVAGAVGAAYGSSRDEYKAANAVIYGASSALIASLVSLYYYDPDKEIADLRKQSRDLAVSLDEFSEGNTRTRSPRMVGSGAALNNFRSLPEKFRRFVTPGEWVVTEIDEYERIDENRIVHKDQMLELVPAQINQK